MSESNTAYYIFPTKTFQKTLLITISTHSKMSNIINCWISILYILQHKTIGNYSMLVFFARVDEKYLISCVNKGGLYSRKGNINWWSKFVWRLYCTVYMSSNTGKFASYKTKLTHFLRLAGCRVNFSNLEFSSFGRATKCFLKAAKKFVIWQINYFFAKRQEIFCEKAAPPKIYTKKAKKLNEHLSHSLTKKAQKKKIKHSFGKKTFLGCCCCWRSSGKTCTWKKRGDDKKRDFFAKLLFTTHTKCFVLWEQDHQDQQQQQQHQQQQQQQQP